MKELTGRKKEIVLLMDEHPEYSQRKIAKEMGLSDATVHQHMEEMNDMGIVENRELTDEVEIVNDSQKLISDLWAFFAGYLIALLSLAVFPSYFPFIAFGAVVGSTPPLIKKLREMDHRDYIKVFR